MKKGIRRRDSKERTNVRKMKGKDKNKGNTEIHVIQIVETNNIFASELLFQMREG